MKLPGKRILVTGGGRGIGAAIALAFAGEGADVCVTARTESQIDAVAEKIRETGRRGVAVTCDVSNPQQVAIAVETATEALGGLDILINNAGGGEERVNVGEDDVDSWRRVIEVNLLGTYYFSRAALPALKQAGGGSIINMGSGMGHEPRVGNSSYNTAKAGVWMLTRCLAMELWSDNIRVNELIPGPVLTDLTAGIFEAGAAHPAIGSERVKQPEDVVPLALFLASQGVDGPTGQSFSLARRPL
jgi:3-oxoacyl-[acyl-carrier protein] reductase